MIKKTKITKTIELVFEEASVLLKEGRSVFEILALYPAHRRELSGLLLTVALLREEKSKTVPSEVFVRRMLSKLDLPVTVPLLHSRFGLIFSLSTVVVVVAVIVVIPKFFTQSTPQDLAIRMSQPEGDQVLNTDFKNLKDSDILKTPKTILGQSALKNKQAVPGIVTPTSVAQTPAATTAFDEAALQNSAQESANFSKDVNDYFQSESQAGEFDAFLNQF